jgi:hypothetical protein
MAYNRPGGFISAPLGKFFSSSTPEDQKVLAIEVDIKERKLWL